MSLGMRYVMARLGAEERTLVGLRRKIVAMLELHIDRFVMGNSHQHAIVLMASDHRTPLIGTKNTMCLLATGVELRQ